MMSRFSPPPGSYKTAPRATSKPILSRRSKYILVPLALIFLCLSATRHSLLFFLPHRSPEHAPSLRYKNVNWSRYAYFQYATSTAYLCNSVMLFEALDRLGSKADRVLLYPEQWDTQIESPTDRDSQLLVKARDWYKVRLVPVDIPVTHDQGQQDGEWNTTFTKFMAWGQERYERVLHLDSDHTVLKHLDELFLLPSAPVAMVRDYQKLPAKKSLASNLLLLQPSEEEFERLMASTRADIRAEGDYDVEILNRFYGDSAMVLPHQAYGLCSSEFRAEDHRNYIGNTYDPWDPEKVLREASLVHFADEPFPKPWVMWPHALYAEKHPLCKAEDCRNKDIWSSLYDDFRKRRKASSQPTFFTEPLLIDKDICALLSAPAPEWPPRNNT
ncbi:MAG: hypothetical protein Q9181_006633, partial [Wetmoreana brouardii]